MGAATAGLPFLPVRGTGRTTSIFERQTTNTTDDTSEGQQKVGEDMRRIATLVITALVGFAMICALAGCSNDETVIRNGLTEEFNQFKDAALVERSGMSGGMPTEVLSAWLDGYAFEIGEITIDGNSATAEISITCKQLYVATANTDDRIANEPSTATTQEEYTENINTILLNELGKLSPVTTKLVLTCEKTSNTWTVSDESVTAYMNALLGQQPAS
jgi:hypothetical protein